MVWLRDSALDIVLQGSLTPTEAQLFPDDLKKLLLVLSRHLEPRRQELLTKRKERLEFYHQGGLPQYLDDHPSHQSDWAVASLPKDLQDRRVEITGPVSNTKMVINMLNPGPDGISANTAMLDFEDSMAPTWDNVKQGIRNVIGVADRSLKYEQIEMTGKKRTYQIDSASTVVPMVRVRGLHLNEPSVIVDGKPIAAGLFDLACCAFWTATTLIERNVTPKYYIPKTESYLESKWWNELFVKLESEMGLARGTLKATLLIETLPAAYQMEEILWEVRERACGLNGGRWDKIFSDIKVLGKNKNHILADRSAIDMSKYWMDNYAKRLIKICHRHGAFAMGGMSAFTPGKNPIERQRQTEKVAADKSREAFIGHDGCWVSHPYFIATAKQQFLKVNQLDVQLSNFPEKPDLLPTFEGQRTLKGLRTNIRVGVAYVAGWNRGLGCISIDGLMEDLATLEISRAQVWQWLYHRVVLLENVTVTPDLVMTLFQEETERLLSEISEEMESIEDYKKVCADYLIASAQCRDLFLEKELPEFFTTYWEGMQNAKRGNGYKMEQQREMEGHTP